MKIFFKIITFSLKIQDLKKEKERNPLKNPKESKRKKIYIYKYIYTKERKLL